MRSTLLRLLPFLIVFSVLFALLRLSVVTWLPILQYNLNGLSWLYSTIALIFSIISAFIIQTLWSRWDRLENAVRGEINSLWELHMFSEQLPLQVGNGLKEAIRDYLEGILHEGWRQIDKGERNKRVEQALKDIQRKIFILSEQSPEKRNMAENIFLSILTNRNDRMHYSSGHLPYLLYVLVILATFLVISLSLFIAVSNIWLDYLFTLSIGLLAFFIFVVIEDLNHPFRPGTWHVTKDAYKELLKEVV